MGRLCHECWHRAHGIPPGPPGECGYDEHILSLPEGAFECAGCGDGVLVCHPVTAAFFLRMHRRNRDRAEQAMTEYAVALTQHRLN